MKQDQRAFVTGAYSSRVAGAYQGDVADRVRRFLPMVRRLAWHVHGSGRPGIEVEDLVQAGLVALTECAQKHQGPGEDGFAAYAKMRVRGAMVDLIRRTVPMSRGATERRRVLALKEQELRGDLGREPLPHELAGAMGIDETELAALRDSSRCASIRSTRPIRTRTWPLPMRGRTVWNCSPMRSSAWRWWRRFPSCRSGYG
jgi:RNA polymerase sigma factor for flagellar operon FliA